MGVKKQINPLHVILAKNPVLSALRSKVAYSEEQLNLTKLELQGVQSVSSRVEKSLLSVQAKLVKMESTDVMFGVYKSRRQALQEYGKEISMRQPVLENQYDSREAAYTSLHNTFQKEYMDLEAQQMVQHEVKVKKVEKEVTGKLRGAKKLRATHNIVKPLPPHTSLVRQYLQEGYTMTEANKLAKNVSLEVKSSLEASYQEELAVYKVQLQTVKKAPNAYVEFYRTFTPDIDASVTGREYIKLKAQQAGLAWKALKEQ